MNYYFYLLICYITQPLRWLMSTIPALFLPKFISSYVELDWRQFPIRLLFSKSPYMYNYVYAHCLFESGHISNLGRISQITNNWLNITTNKNNKSGKYYSSTYTSSNGYTWRKYKSKYSNFYDYFYLLKTEYPEAWHFMQKTPIAPYEPHSKYNENYITHVSASLMARNYTVGISDISHASRIYSIEQDFRVNNSAYYTNLFGSALLYFIISFYYFKWNSVRLQNKKLTEKQKAVNKRLKSSNRIRFYSSIKKLLLK